MIKGEMLNASKARRANIFNQIRVRGHVLILELIEELVLIISLDFLLLILLRWFRARENAPILRCVIKPIFNRKLFIMLALWDLIKGRLLLLFVWEIIVILEDVIFAMAFCRLSRDVLFLGEHIDQIVHHKFFVWLLIIISLICVFRLKNLDLIFFLLKVRDLLALNRLLNLKC